MKLSILLIATGIFASVAGLAKNPDDPNKRSNDGVAIVIAFPEKNIPLPTDPTIWNKMARIFDFDRDDHWMVGHTGLLLIDKKSGETKYVDFGRYDDRLDLDSVRPENYGVVRTPETVPSLILGIKARFQGDFISNLDSLLIHIAAKPLFKSYGRIEAASYHHLNFDRMINYVKEISQKGYVKYGCPTQQYCSRFARQVIRKGGGRYSLGTYTGMQMVKWNRKNL